MTYTTDLSRYKKVETKKAVPARETSLKTTIGKTFYYSIAPSYKKKEEVKPVKVVKQEEKAPKEKKKVYLVEQVTQTPAKKKESKVKKLAKSLLK